MWDPPCHNPSKSSERSANDQLKWGVYKYHDMMINKPGKQNHSKASHVNKRQSGKQGALSTIWPLACVACHHNRPKISIHCKHHPQPPLDFPSSFLRPPPIQREREQRRELQSQREAQIFCENPNFQNPVQCSKQTFDWLYTTSGSSATPPDHATPPSSSAAPPRASAGLPNPT